jgi:trehalose/maltose hydrolase-like predicted phosphorylase
MFPVIQQLYPSLGVSLLQYRADRVGPAKLHAAWLGHDGAMYPWTSTYTGFPTTPDAVNFDDNEQHVTADVGLAFKLFYYTHVSEWPQAAPTFLSNFWEVLSGTCAFWASRFVPAESAPSNYTLKHIMGPDE